MLPFHRLQTNAYRILGISAASTWTKILNGAAALQRLAMLGIEEREVDCFGEIVRDEAAIRTAIGTLNDPRERVQHRLLWFHGPVCLESNGGAGPWPKLGPSEIEHEKALSQLAAALRLEDLGQIVAALREWHVFLGKKEYWEFLAQSETQQNFEPAANAEDLEALREQAMALAAEPLVSAARSAWSGRHHSTLRSYLAALRQLEDFGPWAAACRQELLFPLTRSLADACLTIEQKYRNAILRRDRDANANRIPCAAALQFYRQHVVPLYNDIATVVAEDEQEARLAQGQTADLLHRIALDHIWANEFETTAELAVEAVTLAAGTIEQARIRAALGKYVAAGEEHLRQKALAEATGTLNEAIAAFDAHFAAAEDGTEAVALLECYRGSVEPALKRLLAAFAQCGDRCGEWRANGAACLAKIASSLAASQDFSQAETLMGEAITLAAGTAALAGLQQSLARIKESVIQARVRKAQLTALEKAVEAFREHGRTLAAWGELIREQEAFLYENRQLALGELSFFRARLYAALQQVAHLAGWEVPVTRTLRDEAARQLTEIAIHHAWVGEAGTAQALLQEAVGLAAGAEAIEALHQNYRTRRREAKPVADQQKQTPPVRRRAGRRPFAAAPLTGSVFSCVTVSITVLAITSAACLAVFPASPPQRPPVYTSCLPAPVPPTPPSEGVNQKDGDPIKRGILLEQIHQEERAVQQMERQLAPLRTEIKELQSAGDSTPAARENLETTQRIFQQLQDKSSDKLLRAKLLRRTYDQLSGP